MTAATTTQSYRYGHVRLLDGSYSGQRLWRLLVGHACDECRSWLQPGDVVTIRNRSHQRALICEHCQPWHVVDDQQFEGPLQRHGCTMCDYLKVPPVPDQACTHCHGTGREPTPEISQHMPQPPDHTEQDTPYVTVTTEPLLVHRVEPLQRFQQRLQDAVDSMDDSERAAYNEWLRAASQELAVQLEARLDALFLQGVTTGIQKQ